MSLLFVLSITMIYVQIIYSFSINSFSKKTDNQTIHMEPDRQKALHDLIAVKVSAELDKKWEISDIKLISEDNLRRKQISFSYM